MTTAIDLSFFSKESDRVPCPCMGDGMSCFWFESVHYIYIYIYRDPFGTSILKAPCKVFMTTVPTCDSEFTWMMDPQPVSVSVPHMPFNISVLFISFQNATHAILTTYFHLQFISFSF